MNDMKIKTAKGTLIAERVDDPDGFVIGIKENGSYIQDLALVVYDEDKKKFVCYVYSDCYTEDHTHKFLIERYIEDEEE